MSRLFLCLICLFLALPAWSAPLSEGDHWAQDAVSVLRVWGLIDEDRNRNFQGDRAISRYEAAALLARALTKLEQKHADFLSREQLHKLNSLREALSEEMEALGVRVGNLSETVERLEQRVTEQERLLFSGEFQTRLVSQSFRNAGNTNSGPQGLNYDNLVGTIAGSNLLPHGPDGILPVIDQNSGRPLTNGTGLTSTLFLNINFLGDEDWDGDLRLFAHTSQGNSIVDAVWGTQPGYLANPFTGTSGLNDPQGRSHTPFTTMGLEKAEVRHSSGLTATIGHFEPDILNPTVFLTPVNPNPNGPALLGGFGFRALKEWERISLEVFGTKLPDGSPGQGAAEYDTNALGAGLRYQDEEWKINLNFLRAANESSGGVPLAVGQTGFFNDVTGGLYGNWVNPNGYLVGQLGGVGDSRVAGANSTSDKRPVPGLPNSDGISRGATFGPQSQTSAGLSVEWNLDNWTLLGDYAFSDYRPNKNSSYSATDSLWRLGAEVLLFDEAVDLNLEYRYTGARYDPFVVSFPTILTGTPVFRVYHRLPSFDNFWHLYALHNTQEFPRNRQGFWLDAGWRYDPDGIVRVAYRNLTQVTSSLQDVRYLPGQLGPTTPNTTVLGFSPGFIDIVFREYSPLAFDAALNPLEDRKGRAESFEVKLDHVFTGTPWRIDLDYEQWTFNRPSGLTAAQGGSQNLVDLKSSVGTIAVGRSLGRDFLLTLGYQRSEISGHYDPGGVYNAFAIANNSVDFKNRNTVQHVPFLKTDWQMASNMNLQTEVRHYFTHDKVPASVTPGPAGGPNSNAHPFSWQGLQVSTALRVTF